MPTYDYICTTCAHAWELEQRIVEDPVRKCPQCGKETAKRQISGAANFILKGGGWYADGYGSKKPSTTESSSSDKPTTAKGESKASTEAATPTSSDTKKTDPGKSDGGSSSGS